MPQPLFKPKLTKYFAFSLTFSAQYILTIFLSFQTTLKIIINTSVQSLKPFKTQAFSLILKSANSRLLKLLI
jgi:hypothetical protein